MPQEITPQPPENLAPENLNPQYVEQKKKSFFKKVKLGLLAIAVILVLVILIAGGRYIYLKTKSNYVVTQQPEAKDSTQVVVVKPEPKEEESSWETFSSAGYKFSIQYPKDDTLQFNEDNKENSLVKIFYKDIIPQKNPTGENLIKGYIISVNPLKLQQRDLNSVVNVKRESFKVSCPESAEISEVSKKVIDNIEGRGFTVSRCNSNYDVSYIPGDNFIYEFIKVYKGDLGFEQNYKSITNQIEQTFKINLESENTGPYTKYEDTRNKISFEYPKEMNTECCQVPEPPISGISRQSGIITLALGNNSQAIGFFKQYIANENLDQFIDQQKQILTDDYKVVKSTEPQGNQTEMTIGGQRAVMLSNYTWQGNDLVYLFYPDQRNLLIISKTGISDNTFNHIVETFKFLN